MSEIEPKRKPHAVLDIPSRKLKALKIERLLDLSLRHQPLKMLEVGTGSGGIAHYFANHPNLHCEVFAVDVVDQRLLLDGYDFFQIHNTSLPFSADFFDVVITNHVIEHVGNYEEQRNHLKEIHRTMKKDGVGYLATPNRWMLVEPHFRLAFLSWLPVFLRSPYLRLMGRGQHYDCTPLSLTSLEDLIRGVGLQYRNLCTRALHEFLSLERPKYDAIKLIEKLPDQLVDYLSPIMPTLIYRLEK